MDPRKGLGSGCRAPKKDTSLGCVNPRQAAFRRETMTRVFETNSDRNTQVECGFIMQALTSQACSQKVKASVQEARERSRPTAMSRRRTYRQQDFPPPGTVFAAPTSDGRFSAGRVLCRQFHGGAQAALIAGTPWLGDQIAVPELSGTEGDAVPQSLQVEGRTANILGPRPDAARLHRGRAD